MRLPRPGLVWFVLISTQNQSLVSYISSVHAPWFGFGTWILQHCGTHPQSHPNKQVKQKPYPASIVFLGNASLWFGQAKNRILVAFNAQTQTNACPVYLLVNCLLACLFNCFLSSKGSCWFSWRTAVGGWVATSHTSSTKPFTHVSYFHIFLQRPYFGQIKQMNCL